MKRLVMWLAMWAGSFGPGLALAGATPPHDADAAWEFACEIMQYDCSNVAQPDIEWSDLYHTYGIYGGYDGGDVIYMDNGALWSADEVMIQSVLAHEMTHYLDAKLGYTDFTDGVYTKETVCQAEMRGWRVGNAYVVSHGRPDFANYGWFIYYGCFQ